MRHCKKSRDSINKKQTEKTYCIVCGEETTCRPEVTAIFGEMNIVKKCYTCRNKHN